MATCKDKINNNDFNLLTPKYKNTCKFAFITVYIKVVTESPTFYAQLQKMAVWNGILNKNIFLVFKLILTPEGASHLKVGCFVQYLWFSSFHYICLIRTSQLLFLKFLGLSSLAEYNLETLKNFKTNTMLLQSDLEHFNFIFEWNYKKDFTLPVVEEFV